MRKDLMHPSLSNFSQEITKCTPPSLQGYLDANAHVPLRPGAKKVMETLWDMAGNPSALHQFGQESARRLEQAREKLADLLNVAPTNLLFTSGGTESNFLALYGMGPHVKRFFVAQGEHDSITHNTFPAAHFFQKSDAAVTYLPLTRHGTVDTTGLELLLKRAKGEAFLCTAAAAHHDTGVVNDLEALSQHVRAHKGYIHTDAVQALGKTPLALRAVDLASFSSYKVGGPLGVGALYIADHTPFTPFIKGGSQERGFRPGTPALPLICGFVEAVCEALSEEAQTHLKGLGRAHREMEAFVLKNVPGARIWGQGAARVPQTTALSMPGVDRELQLMVFDQKGYGVSAGSACRAGLREASPLLSALKNQNMAEEEDVQGTLRVSSGWHTAPETLAHFGKAWVETAHSLNPSSRALKASPSLTASHSLSPSSCSLKAPHSLAPPAVSSSQALNASTPSSLHPSAHTSAPGASAQEKQREAAHQLKNLNSTTGSYSWRAPERARIPDFLSTTHNTFDDTKKDTPL